MVTRSISDWFWPLRDSMDNYKIQSLVSHLRIQIQEQASKQINWGTTCLERKGIYNSLVSTTTTSSEPVYHDGPVLKPFHWTLDVMWTEGKKKLSNNFENLGNVLGKSIKVKWLSLSHNFFWKIFWMLTHSKSFKTEINKYHRLHSRSTSRTLAAHKMPRNAACLSFLCLSKVST